MQRVLIVKFDRWIIIVSGSRLQNGNKAETHIFFMCVNEYNIFEFITKYWWSYRYALIMHKGFNYKMARETLWKFADSFGTKRVWKKNLRLGILNNSETLWSVL